MARRGSSWPRIRWFAAARERRSVSLSSMASERARENERDDKEP